MIAVTSLSTRTDIVQHNAHCYNHMPQSALLSKPCQKRKRGLMTHVEGCFSSPSLFPHCMGPNFAKVSTSIPENLARIGPVLFNSRFWRSENRRLVLKKKVLLMTHLPISPILNAAVQMTSSRNSGWSR